MSGPDAEEDGQRGHRVAGGHAGAQPLVRHRRDGGDGDLTGGNGSLGGLSGPNSGEAGGRGEHSHDGRGG